MSLGLHACLRPYDVTIHQSVISTECDDVTASCVVNISTNETRENSYRCFKDLISSFSHIKCHDIEIKLRLNMSYPTSKL